MYSARAVNAGVKAYCAPSQSSLSNLGEILPAQEAVLPGFGGVLVNRLGDFALQERQAWIFISIKNRSFNRPYINRFIDMCDQLGLQGHICPVDDPYRYNAMAELQCDHLPDAEAEKIQRLSKDITRMVQKAINGKLTKNVDIVRWCDLEARTPTIYREELTRAFKAGGRIREALRQHIGAVKSFDTERDFERFAEFFLCEVPVLMHTYYNDGPSMDIYPGPQPKFFWEIELGVFESELPELTALTRSGSRSLLYLDTHDRSRKPS